MKNQLGEEWLQDGVKPGRFLRSAGGVLLMAMFLLLPQKSSVAGWQSERENLDRVYALNQFRIFYTLNGQHALADQSDEDANGVPDLVENIATQFEAADVIYHAALGFMPPRLNSRYKDQVQTIDVHVLSQEYKGKSGDRVIHYRYKILGKKRLGALSITLSRQLQTGNLTPAHELFHAYQNGYTMFKNRWFTEGTSRWAEYAFKQGTGEQEELPNSQADLENLFRKTYDAKYFWNRLTHLCTGKNSVFKVPEVVLNKTYAGTDQLVVEGNDLDGYEFMVQLFENLDRYDLLAARERGFAEHDWQESEQKSPANNRYIVMALRDTITQFNCTTHPEVKALTDIFTDYLNVSEAQQGKDMTEFMETVANPYRSAYRDGEDVYARNIWDMQVYAGRLFVGGGNLNNSGPAPNAGPVPIISYDPAAQKTVTEGRVDDEEITTYTVLDDRLYIPGSDATESHEWGNFYLRNQDGTWLKKRTIPAALHNYSLTFYNNRLVAGISTRDGAAVAISDDNGDHWENILLGPKQRTYALLEVGGELYAVQQFVPPRERQTWPQELQEEYSTVAQYGGRHAFLPRPDLTEQEMFPDTLLAEKRGKRITRYIRAGEKAVYIGAYNFKRPFGFYIASSLAKDHVKVARIPIPRSYVPRDLLVRGDILYLLCSEEVDGSYKQSVVRTSLSEPEESEVLFQFSTAAFARSFEEMDGDFYFGLGCDVRNTKKWSMDEVHPDTGKIIKISSKHIW